LKVWVAGSNQLAIEIESLNAGLIPIPLDDALGRFVDSMNESGWRMQWKQSTSGEVLVVSLDEADTADASSERAVLETVELVPGKLRIAGRRQTKRFTQTAEKPLLDTQGDAAETDGAAVK
jgi:hypothetical protein